MFFVRADSKRLSGERLVASGEIWKRGRDREFFGLKDVTPGVPADPSGMHKAHLEKEAASC